MRRISPILLIAAVLLITASAYAQDADVVPDNNTVPEQINWYAHIVSCLITAAIGAGIGAFFSYRLRKVRKALSLMSKILVVGVMMVLPGCAQIASFLIGYFVAYRFLSGVPQKIVGHFKQFKQTVFGTAEWASLEYLQEHGLTEPKGIFLGMYRQRLKSGTILETPLYSSSPRNVLLIAPSRMGKGVSCIIPNLLTYEGSAVVIDPKGENALITAERRGSGNAAKNISGMGQKVFLVDPFGIITDPENRACFNPIDWLLSDMRNINENAMILADSIIVPHSAKDAFWDDEAKALCTGFLLHVATSPSEEARRTLGRIRDITTSGQSDLDQIWLEMLASENPVVRSTALRSMQKEPKLLSNVMATLQAHTHFLDSPAIRESLSRSDFSFEDLKKIPMTVYPILPADRLNGTFSRWLRLLIQVALTVNARNIQETPEKPVLFMLDEMAALGKLTMVEQGWGLLAGFGIRLFGVIQDLSQLERIYEKGAWETFIANSGAILYYGSRDLKSAEYFSKLAGVTTKEKFSWSQSFSRMIGFSHTSGTSSGSSFSSGASGGSSSTTSGSSSSSTVSTSETDGESESRDVVQRPLITADELTVMRRDEALLLVENLNPIKGFRIKWFSDEKLKRLGSNILAANNA